jgi:hypothetical protein
LFTFGEAIAWEFELFFDFVFFYPRPQYKRTSEPAAHHPQAILCTSHQRLFSLSTTLSQERLTYIYTEKSDPFIIVIFHFLSRSRLHLLKVLLPPELAQPLPLDVEVGVASVARVRLDFRLD